MVNFSAILETIRELKQLPNLNRIIQRNRYTLAINRAYGKNMGNFNAPGTKWNKDEKFAKISPDESTKIKWGEAIAVDGGDEMITVFGWVESCTGLKNFDDDKWTFEPCLCAVEIRKKTLEGKSKTSGKEYKFEAYPMGLAFIDALASDDAVGFGKPFKGLLDVSAGSEVALWLKGLPNGDGEVAEPEELAFIKKKMLVITPLEKLEKLEGVTLPEGKQSRGNYGGGGGQKESAKLDDRLAFILKASNAENESLEQVLKSRFPGAEDDTRQMLVASWLEKLVN